MTTPIIEVDPDLKEVAYHVRVNGLLIITTKTPHMARSYARAIADAFDAVGVKYGLKGLGMSKDG